MDTAFGPAAILPIGMSQACSCSRGGRPGARPQEGTAYDAINAETPEPFQVPGFRFFRACGLARY